MPHLESAALGVWIKSGSRNETKDQHGIAHLLEHMAFKGTKKRTALQIAEEIENVGGELNAATSTETTAYYARVLKPEEHRAPSKASPHTKFENTSMITTMVPNMVLSASGAVDHDALVKQAETTYSSFKNSSIEEARTTTHQRRYHSEELDRARAQIRSGLLMAMESPAARAGQIARQILLFGRQIPNDELMERLDALSVERVRDLAGRIFHESTPTLSAVGPVQNIPRLEEIKDRLDGSLYLRTPTHADYNQWVQLRRDSKSFLKPWEPLWPEDDLSVIGYRRRMKSYAQQRHNGTSRTYFLFTRGDNKLVGGISLTRITYGITRSAMLAACLPRNTTSINLLKKSGFGEEGYAREYLEINNVREDHILFAILGSDFALSIFAWLMVSFSAHALEPVSVSIDDIALDITSAIDAYKRQDGTLKISTAPDAEGIVRRIEVRSKKEDGISHWAVFFTCKYQ
ncbi:putative zinc protease [Nymphon striatum]|nr:putative zinc protease [Nymphon striatum]